jgi:predicted Zn-dependent protease
MSKSAKILLGAASFLLLGLILWMTLFPSQPPFVRSFTPIYRALGVAPMSLNNFITRIMPIGDMDEKAWGHLYRSQNLEEQFPEYSQYVNEVMNQLSQDLDSKGFDYRVFISASPVKNAYALAGGNIIITKGLIDVLETEAELAAVLLHEMAHIELGHCLNLIRTEVLANKIDYMESFEAFDFILRIFLQSGYSKNQEADADDWSFARLPLLGYHPMGMPRAFQRMIPGEQKVNQPEKGAFAEYFETHPDLQLRVETFEERAKGTMLAHPQGLYVGREAYTIKIFNDSLAPLAYFYDQ